MLPFSTSPGNRPEARLRTVVGGAFPSPQVRSARIRAGAIRETARTTAGCRPQKSRAASWIRRCRRDSLMDKHSRVGPVGNRGVGRRGMRTSTRTIRLPSLGPLSPSHAPGRPNQVPRLSHPGADRPTAAVRPGREITARADRVGGIAATQKYVVAVVLVPLSQVIVTVQFRNRGTAGTIRRSYLELAGKAKLRLKPSVAYVHCDDTPLRSVM
jgi:hypothetical protein